MDDKITVDHAGTIQIGYGDTPQRPYKHQEEAIQRLNSQIIEPNKSPFAGLLVIPTGGGKTLTAVQWLLRNCIDNNQKVLWIAHRHELLEQAKEAFQHNAYSNILRKRKSFNYRIISGIHDKPKDIQSSDDIIIASKDSLNSESALNYLFNWLAGTNGELFLVIDEAHHAIAKTYRKLIVWLKEKARLFRMLGLTATPFRTAQNEQGLLKKLFTDDIVYKVDLRTLINRGILAEPIFEELQTEFDMTEVLTDEDLKKIQFFDIKTIGEQAAKTIAENRKRNNRIVNHYVINQAKYGQTLIFALNIDNAIALNRLFIEKGIASDYVVATIRDGATGVILSPRENREKVERFRKGELRVLINVNILTEGADLPQVQTVFLTRPTISTLLMTQMIGRGLRGEKAGGTKNVYIVSFIDNWKDKIAWVNPEKLFIEKNVDFNDESPETVNGLIRLIAIEKLEEFARLMDQSIDTTELENLDFITRIPIGLYTFSILKSSGNQENEKNCEILVYDNIKQAYTDFIHDLPEFFKVQGVAEKETLTDEELDELGQKVEDEYFYGYEKLPGYRLEDIKDLLRYYALYETQPQFIEFKDRPKFDVSRVAAEIYKQRLGGETMQTYLNQVWESDQIAWQAFFGYDRRYFVNEVFLAYRKLLFLEDFPKTTSQPQDIKELRDLEKLSLTELREKAPQYWRELRDKVFEKAKDKDGYYTSAQNGFKNKYKIYFQIDHIIPFSKGGLTTLENLQLLTRQENARKGSSTTIPPEVSPPEQPPPSKVAIKDERVLIFITDGGFIKGVPYLAFPASTTNFAISHQDTVTNMLVAGPSDTVLFFTNWGKVYTKTVSYLSADGLTGQGTSLARSINLASGETVVTAIAVPGFKINEDLVMLTRQGRIKRIGLGEFEAVRPSGLVAISANESAGLGWVRRIHNDQELILVSCQGQALRFEADNIRVMRRNAGSIAAMKLRPHDEVAGIDVVDSVASLLVATTQGWAKCTPLSEYPPQKRNSIGVYTLAGDMDKTGTIVAAYVVSSETEVILISQNSLLQRIAIKEIPQQGRATQGRRIIKLTGNDVITAVTTLAY